MSLDVYLPLRWERERAWPYVPATEITKAPSKGTYRPRLCALLSNDTAQAQKLLIHVEEKCHQVGLITNKKKAKVIMCNTPSVPPLQTQSDQLLENVTDFKYLGSWANSTTQDMKIRKALAWKALNGMKMVWRSIISRELKLKFFCGVVEAVLLYGSECWTMNISLQKSPDGSYTRMLRVVLNVNWRDHICNNDLYGDLPKVSDKVAWRRLGLAGHCQRHEELPAYHLVLWEPTHGKRRSGRPSTIFVDTLKRDVGAANTAELAACVTKRGHWASRRAARLRPP